MKNEPSNMQKIVAAFRNRRAHVCSESTETACYTPKTISEMWPVFLEWVADYAGDSETAAHASYSREDMRYAYQAGYEFGKKEEDQKTIKD